MTSRSTRAPASCGASRRRARRGMSLVEVLVALVILSTVLIALCEYLGRFAREVNVTAVNATAGDLVTSRLEAIKGITRYDRVDSHAVTETAIPGFPGYRRITSVARVANAREDYKLVTVRVTHPFLGADTVRKTTVVPRF